jgi:hypothetical protein
VVLVPGAADVVCPQCRQREARKSHKEAMRWAKSVKVVYENTSFILALSS